MVSAGRRNLDCEPGLGLSHHIRQVGDRLIIGSRCRDPFVQPCSAVQPLLQLAQRPNTEYLNPIYQAGLGEVADRNHDRGPALAFGRQHCGQYTAHRADAAIEGQFAE